MRFSIYFSLSIILTSTCCSIHIPSSFPKCCVKDSHLNECLLKTANNLQPFMGNGVEQLEIPSLNPFFIPEFIATQNTEALNFTATLRNWVFHSLHNYKFHELRYNPETYTLNGNVEIRPTGIKSDYEVSGRFLFFNIEGKGNGTAAFGTMNISFEITGKLAKKKGVDYYKPDAVKINLIIADYGVELVGLIDNDQLGRITNGLLNQNSKEIIHNYAPIFENLFESNLLRYLKFASKKIPYNDIFPCS